MTKTKTLTQGALWTLGAVLILVACALLWTVRSVLFLVFVSLLLASGIDPLVARLRRGRLNRGFAILLIYLLIFAAFGLVVYLSLPPLVQQVGALVQNFSSQESANQAISQIGNPFLQQFANTIYHSIGDIAQNIVSFNQAISFSLSIFSGLFGGITVFVITFYWLTERQSVQKFVLSFFPREKREENLRVWQAIEAKLGAWVRGQLTLMLFIGIASWIGYSLLGIKFAIALGFIAGLTELIPLVGPYIGGGAAFLVALTQGVTPALLVVGFVIVLQMVEGNLLVPRIMQRAVGVSSLAVILGILVGSAIMGIPGALIAVPVVAVIQIVYNHVMKPDSAEDVAAPHKEMGKTSADDKAERQWRIKPAFRRDNNRGEGIPT